MISACAINVIPKFLIYQQSNCNQYQTQLCANVTTDIHSLTNVSIYVTSIPIVRTVAIGIILKDMHEYPRILWTIVWVGPIRNQSQLMHCKIRKIHLHNRSKNVKWVYQCVRVLYHIVQTPTCSSETTIMVSPIKRLIKVSNA